MRIKLSLLLAMATTIMISASCGRDPIVVDASQYGVETPSQIAGMEQPVDGCDCDEPLIELRWLQQIVKKYDNDTITNVAIYRALTFVGEKRIFVATSDQDVFDTLVMYNYCGDILDTLTFASSNIFDVVSSKSFTCIYQNYNHRIEEGFCHVENPLEDMPWLHYFVRMYNHTSVQGSVSQCQYEYESEIAEGFLIDRCVNCTDKSIELYDCLGNLLEQYVDLEHIGSAEYAIIDSTITLIYKNY